MYLQIFRAKKRKKMQFFSFLLDFRPPNRPKRGRRAPKTIRRLSENYLQIPVAPPSLCQLLHSNQLGVDAICCHQLGVSALLGNASVVDNQNAVGIVDRA